MLENVSLNQDLLDQKLNDFILEVLLADSSFVFSDVSFDYTKHDFYLKVTDKLIPSLYYDKSKQTYLFPTYVLLRLNLQNVVYYAEKEKDIFFTYLKNILSSSVEFNNFINRLNHTK